VTGASSKGSSHPRADGTGLCPVPAVGAAREEAAPPVAGPAGAPVADRAPGRGAERRLTEVEQLAHDLGEPMRGVVDSVRLLARHCEGRLDPMAERCVSDAIAEARRMQRLIGDLVDYADFHHRERRRYWVDAQIVVEDVVDGMRPALEEAGASVEVGPLPSVHADRFQLATVFEHLLANALRFRSATPPAIGISAERDAAAWVFTIADNGIGIAAAHRERVFDLFFRRVPDGRVHPGTGIGLAVCRRIVEAHGGVIRVQETPARGSRVSFSIEDR
jgi:light-regulated signal transduction histidine kinase (bacteriophytochrome)